jgi:hypothetical protein
MRDNASSIGASLRSVTSAKRPWPYWSSTLAVRLLAMPGMRLAPSASTRARSAASNTSRAGPALGASLLCSRTSWQPAVNAKLSAQPRMTAISLAVGTRDGSGSCTFLPSSSGLPGA